MTLLFYLAQFTWSTAFDRLPGQEAARQQMAAGEGSRDCPVDPLPAGALGRIGTARLRHNDEVTCIALSPDGATLASGGGILDRHKIRLWDRITGKEIAWPRPADSILSIDALAFSPDAKTLAALAEMTVFLWDARSASHLLKFDVPDACNTLCFTPDGHALATAGQFSRTIRLWDKDTGKLIRAFMGTPDSVTCIAFSPDGRTLASGDSHGVVYLWEVDSGRQLGAVTTKGLLWVSSVAFSPDGKLLAWSGSAKVVFLHNLDSNRELPSLRGHQGAIDTLAFAPDGKSLATGSWDQTIRIWNVAAAKEISCLKGHEGKVRSVLFSSDGKFLVSSGDMREQGIRLWDVASGRETHNWDCHRRPVTTLAFSPDGALVASGSQDRSIRLWRPGSAGKCLGVLGQHEAGVSALAFSPDGRRVSSAAYDKTIGVINVVAGKSIWSARTRTTISSLAFDAGGRIVAGLDETLRLWDVASGSIWTSVPGQPRIARSFEGGNQPTSSTLPSFQGFVGLALSPDARIQVGTQDYDVCIRELGGAQFDKFQIEPADEFIGFAFSADSNTLAAIYRSHVQHYDIGRRTEFRSFPIVILPKERVVFALSPDGNLLALARDRVIELWEMATGMKIRDVCISPEPLTCLTFGPDGRTLYSASSDTTVLIWDLAGMITSKVLPAAALTETELLRQWEELACSNPATAYRSLWRLVWTPNQAIGLLQSKMHVASLDDSRKIRQLIANLDDRRYIVRQDASNALEAFGPSITPTLRQVLAKPISLEVRHRIEYLLSRFVKPSLSQEHLRASRAVLVLEQIGSPAARDFLDQLSRGGEYAWQTSEAQRALERLAKKRAASVISSD
jgi:WD40 repeat protein